MRFIDLKETVNHDVFNPAFNDTQFFDGLTYRASSEEDHQGKPYFVIKVFDDNFERVGLVKFALYKDKSGNEWLESLISAIQPEYRGRGIAGNIYAYARMLGNTIKPSSDQTQQGRDMWTGWEKSGAAKHLTSNESRFSDYELAIMEGGHSLDKPKSALHQAVTEDSGNSLQTIIQSFVASPIGQKYKQYDCKTVTRAFVQWAEQNKIPTQVVSLAPPNADFIAKNPRYKGKSGQGDGHIMPIVNGNAIDFTVRQFGVSRPFENPLITPVGNLPAVYGKFGYFTDKPEWFLGGKSHWVGALNSIPSEIFNQNFGDELLEQGVAEGLSEARNSLFAFVKQQFPTWPDYVLKDFLYQQAKGIRDQAELDDFLKRNKQDFGNCKWTLTKLPITFDIFTQKTQRMLASREGGSSNPFQVPRDAERHAQQSQMIQQKGVSDEPIIVAKLSNGYDLIEGWHRTIQHLKAFPQGYTGPAWVCTGATYKSESVEQDVAENFADGKVKGKSRPGRVKRSGASCDGSVSDLRSKAKNASGERAKMYHWCANMKSGRADESEILDDLEEGWKDWVAGAALGAAALAPQTADAKSAPQQKPAITQQVQGDANYATKLILKPEAKILIQTARAAGMRGKELAQFVAQCAHETANFSSLKELGGRLDFKKYDPKYNPRKAKMLGNKQVGDGAKYLGRGYIQLTGRDNYKRAGQALGLPLEEQPELVERPDIAAKVAVWFWQNQVAPKVSNFNDTASVTKPINSGLKGLQDRHNKFASIMALMSQKS